MKRHTAIYILGFVVCISLTLEFTSQSASKSVSAWPPTMTVREDVAESARADRNPSIKAENYTNASNDGARHSTGKVADSADSDPDLPPFARGRIDEDTYLRLREEHIARLRGLEPDKPFDPAARGRAMQTMEDQQTRLRETANDFALSSLIELAGAWNPIGPAPIPNGQVTGG